MKKIYFLIFALFTINIASAQWQAIPINYNYWINSLATDSNKVLMSTMKGVHLSSNFGINWTLVDSSSNAKYLNGFVFKGDSIFAFSHLGVFLSTNNASGWTAMNNGLTNVFVRALEKEGNNLYAGTSSGEIFKSNNNASSWTNINTGFTNTYINDLLIDGNNFFAATNRGVYLSTNNGINWNQINSGLTDTNVSVLTKSGNNILAGTYAGKIYSSSNNGSTWNLVLSQNNSIGGLHTSSFATIADTVYAAVTFIGVFRSTDNGNTWLFTNQGMLDSVNCLTVAGNNVLAGTWHGLCKHSFADFWKKYSITTISSPLSGGATTGGGIYTIYHPCIVKAIPNQGFTFSNWSINAPYFNWYSDTVYTFDVLGNWNVFANFNILAMAAGSISGDTLFCAPITNKMYHVPPIAGVYNDSTGYEWDFNGSYNSLRRSITGDTVYIDFSTFDHGGYLTVRGKNASGFGPSSPPYHINVLSAPNGFSYYGNTIFCSPDTVNINLINEPYTTYSWNLNSIPGLTVLNTTPTSCSLYANLAPGNNQFIHFSSSNMCGSNSSHYIVLKPLGLPLNPGTITGSTYVYAGQQNVVYMVPQNLNNYMSYLWTLPTGVNGFSTQFNINADFGLAAVSGNISVKASNICGTGPESFLYVNVSPVIPNCNANFNVIADTNVLHHYFIINNSTGVQPLHYLWNWGDGTQDTIMYPSHTYNVAGYYNICLTITDSVGCTNSYCNFAYLQKSPDAIISVQVIPQGSINIDDNIFDNKVNIYPNPAKNQITIEYNSIKNQDLAIYNLLGQKVYTTTFKDKVDIDISAFQNGVYFIKINTDKQAIIKKFVKEQL